MHGGAVHLCRPNNLIAQSQAGTGKTAAFALCMLGRTDETVPAVQALCIAPTRELARQIGDVVVQMAKFTKISVFMAIKEREGGTSASSPTDGEACERALTMLVRRVPQPRRRRPDLFATTSSSARPAPSRTSWPSGG